MTLWKLCEHGEKDAHSWLSGTGNSLLFIPIVTCPGGRPATVEDVREALGGEKIWYCVVHKSTTNPVLDRERDKGTDLEMWAGCHDSLWSFASGMGDRGQEDKVGKCRMVERILTPALDQEKQT